MKRLHSNERGLQTRWALLLALLGVLTSLFSGPANAADFAVRTLSVAPFRQVKMWAPSPTSPGRFPIVVLLHGSLGPTDDPLWMLNLHFYPPFDHAVLIVPALDPQPKWSQPTIVAGLDRLIDQAARDYNVDLSRIYMVGFSAGANHGYKAAASLRGRLAGFAAIAGTPSRLNAADLKALSGLRVLTVCMELDSSYPCTKQAMENERLKQAGVVVQTEQVAGIGHECPFPFLAPRLRSWMQTGSAEVSPTRP